MEKNDKNIKTDKNKIEKNIKSNETNNSNQKRASTSFKATMKHHKPKLALDQLSGAPA